MTKYILVPLDGSALAEMGLPLVVALARLTSSTITLLRVVPAPSPVEHPIDASPAADGLQQPNREELSAAHAYLDKVRKHLEHDVLDVHTEIVEGDPATAIAEYAEQNGGVWLTAMVTRHSPCGAWVFGSVAEKVLHSVHKSVLLTRPTKLETEATTFAQPALHTIVVPLDGSRFAEAVLDQARYLALLTGATLALVCAVAPPHHGEIEQVEFMPISADLARERETILMSRYLADTAEQLRAEGFNVLTELVYGRPAEMILRAAERLHGDLIAMAAHGRRDLERLWLGSVAQKVVQGSTLPVLLMRHP